MLEDGSSKHLTLIIRKQKLLREVRKDAQTSRTGFYHEVNTSKLTGKVQLTSVIEGGGHHRKYALVTCLHVIQ